MVTRWDIVTIGNLSRNRYWGESDERAVRPVLCTSTLITTDRGRLLVDPSLADTAQTAAELDRRTGLKPTQVDSVFITHEHGDHTAGLASFPNATWLAAKQVAEAINKVGQYSKRVESVEGWLLDTIEIIQTPGHTLSHHSLRFRCGDLYIVVAGDAVPTRDFWRDRRGFFNSVDLGLARETMVQLGIVADVIIPGHDNWFLTHAVRNLLDPRLRGGVGRYGVRAKKEDSRFPIGCNRGQCPPTRGVSDSSARQD